jgi:3,4-dihydroxy 2-butanone 4-phosphate synthase
MYMLKDADKRIKQALNDIRQGKPILILDDLERENEADLIIAAETLTTEVMAQMIRDGSGIVCLTLPHYLADHLKLPLMVKENSSKFKTAFTVSIEAKFGVTTGVSAQDRTTTIHTAISDNATWSDLNRPGHVFPIRGQEGGVLTRRGHTEASLDLARLAGLKNAGVLCELTNPNGTMAHGEQVYLYAKKHQLTIITIEELVQYRVNNNI